MPDDPQNADAETLDQQINDAEEWLKAPPKSHDETGFNFQNGFVLKLIARIRADAEKLEKATQTMSPMSKLNAMATIDSYRAEMLEIAGMVGCTDLSEGKIAKAVAAQLAAARPVSRPPPQCPHCGLELMPGDDCCDNPVRVPPLPPTKEATPPSGKAEG